MRRSIRVGLADRRTLADPAVSINASKLFTPTNGCREDARTKTREKNNVRTIHLRYDGQGTWYVSVTQEHHPPLSHTPYASTPHALRAFVYEGQQQPFARMLIHVSKKESAVVIRKARSCARERERDAHAIDIKSAKAAVARAGVAGTALQSLNEFL